MILLFCLLPFFANCLLISKHFFKMPIDNNGLAKVLILENCDNLFIESIGKHNIINISDGTLLQRIVNRRENLFLSSTRVGLCWGAAYPGIHQLQLCPIDDKSSMLINGIEYRGIISIYVVDSKIQIVNELSLEDLIGDIILTNAGNYLPETIRALAIVLRTYLYSQIDNSSKFWHYRGCQIGYSGSAAAAWSDKNVIDIARSTADKLLIHSHLPFLATWCKDSGGQTACYSAIYRKECPTPGGVNIDRILPQGLNSPEWRQEITVDELMQAFGITVTKIDRFADKSSGKIYALRLVGDDKFLEMTIGEFMDKLGHKILSNQFVISKKPGTFIFTGKGLGMGVGLCLATANIMAANGDEHADILEKMFPMAHIVNCSFFKKL